MNAKSTLTWLRTFSVIFGVVGAVAWVAPPLWGSSETLRQAVPPHVELPLSFAGQVLIRPGGPTYVGIEGFSAVAVYGSDGDYDRRFGFETAGGTFAFALVGDGIEVATARNDRWIQFRENGDVVFDRRDPTAFQRVRVRAKVQGGGGANPLWPGFARDDDALAANPSAWLRVFQAPFPAAAYWLVAVGCVVVRRQLSRREKHRRQAGASK